MIRIIAGTTSRSVGAAARLAAIPDGTSTTSTMTTDSLWSDSMREDPWTKDLRQ
jgi:hypothetical protein